jgi:hypothetical protein|nr:MAG TPA: hypothetical protein [Caudoviricetes sp.]
MTKEDQNLLKIIKDNFQQASLNVETRTFVLVLPQFTAFVDADCVTSDVKDLVVNSSVSPTNGRQYIRVKRANTVKISWKV